MPMTVYRFRDGRSFGAPAQAVGERLEELRRRNGGSIAPADVVEDAADLQSPLNRCFTWDLHEAATRHWEHRARQLLNSLIVVEIEVVRNRPETIERTCFVSVGKSVPGGARYVDSVEAMSDADSRDHVLRSAIVAMQGWRRRYGHLAELAEVVAAIDAAPVRQAVAV